MRSWKTTLSGAITALASLVLTLSTAGIVLPKWANVVAGFVASGGFAAIGIFAKDSNVTGVSGSSGDKATK